MVTYQMTFQVGALPDDIPKLLTLSIGTYGMPST